MDTRSNICTKTVSILILAAFWTFGLAACEGQGAFPVTPTQPPPTLASPTHTPTNPLPVIVFPTPTLPCVDNLVGLEDITIPDDTVVSPGELLDKQWLVLNAGSCNWDSRYRLRLTSADALGAAPEQALYPARAGAQAVVRILFTAPLEEGSYYSEWQAFDPNGIPFGDVLWIRIVVQP